jgi:tagatose-1,6-bisphosphate aldolase
VTSTADGIMSGRREWGRRHQRGDGVEEQLRQVGAEQLHAAAGVSEEALDKDVGGRKLRTTA